MGGNDGGPEVERFLLMGAAILFLLMGIWTGLIRLGWSLPLPAGSRLAGQHGALMIAGFLGIVIPIERAVAVDHRMAYLVPALSAGGLVILFAIPGGSGAGRFLVFLASMGYLGMFLYFLSLDCSLHNGVMLLGAVFWTMGNGFWLAGYPFADFIFLWAGFLLLTIAGERLELARTFFMKPYQKWIFGGIVLLVSMGILLMTVFSGSVISTYATSVGLIAMALWLLLVGPSRRTLHVGGLTRYIAVNLLGGYVWLLFGGIILALYRWHAAGPVYDTLLHSLFLGFVFSMIFAHAPIIFPAVTGRRMSYSSFFYVHTIVLHVTLAFRVAGNLLHITSLSSWGGFGNAMALLIFLVTGAYGIIQQTEPGTGPAGLPNNPAS